MHGDPFSRTGSSDSGTSCIFGYGKVSTLTHVFLLDSGRCFLRSSTTEGATWEQASQVRGVKLSAVKMKAYINISTSTCPTCNHVIRVSDLPVLGSATISEARALLSWLRDKQGIGALAVAGNGAIRSDE